MGINNREYSRMEFLSANLAYFLKTALKTNQFFCMRSISIKDAFGKFPAIVNQIVLFKSGKEFDVI